MIYFECSRPKCTHEFISGLSRCRISRPPTISSSQRQGPYWPAPQRSPPFWPCSDPAKSSGQYYQWPKPVRPKYPKSPSRGDVGTSFSCSIDQRSLSVANEPPRHQWSARGAMVTTFPRRQPSGRRWPTELPPSPSWAYAIFAIAVVF